MKIRKLDYLIRLTWDKDYNGYVADVVNLYGCMSQGKTKKEAIANAEKAIKAFTKVAIKPARNTEFMTRSVDIPPRLLHA